MLCKAVVAPWFTMAQGLDHELPCRSVPSLVWASCKGPAIAHLLVCVHKPGGNGNLEKLMDSLGPQCCSIGCAFAGYSLYHYA